MFHPSPDGCVTDPHWLLAANMKLRRRRFDWSFVVSRPIRRPIKFARCSFVFVGCHDDGWAHHLREVFAKPCLVLVDRHLYDSLTTELYGGADVRGAKFPDPQPVQNLLELHHALRSGFNLNPQTKKRHKMCPNPSQSTHHIKNRE